MRTSRFSKYARCWLAEEMSGGFRSRDFDPLAPASFFFTVLPDEPFLVSVCLDVFFLSSLEVDFLGRLDLLIHGLYLLLTYPSLCALYEWVIDIIDIF